MTVNKIKFLFSQSLHSSTVRQKISSHTMLVRNCDQFHEENKAGKGVLFLSKVAR
jgi:hypothetical protein